MDHDHHGHEHSGPPPGTRGTGMAEEPVREPSHANHAPANTYRASSQSIRSSAKVGSPRSSRSSPIRSMRRDRRSGSSAAFTGLSRVPANGTPTLHGQGDDACSSAQNVQVIQTAMLAGMNASRASSRDRPSMFGCSSPSVAEPNHASLMSRPETKNVPAAISHSQCVVDLHRTSRATRPKPSEYAASTPSPCRPMSQCSTSVRGTATGTRLRSLARDDWLAMRRRRLPIRLPQHADQHHPKDPILLAWRYPGCVNPAAAPTRSRRNLPYTKPGRPESFPGAAPL